MSVLQLSFDYTKFRWKMQTYDPIAIYGQSTAFAFQLASEGNFTAMVDMDLISKKEAKAIIARKKEYNAYFQKAKEQTRDGILFQSERIYSLLPVFDAWEIQFDEKIGCSLLQFHTAPMLIRCLEKDDKTEFMQWQEMMRQRLRDMKVAVGFPTS